MFKGVSHKLIVLIEVGKIIQSASLDFAWHIPVQDLACLVIIGWVVERSNLKEIHFYVSHVVSDDVEHHPDIFFMAGLDQLTQFFISSERRVDTEPV